MADRFVNPQPKYTSAINGTLPGGKLFFFETGTTTLKTIFEDQAETTPAENPAILDATGTVPDIFLDGTYRVKHTDADDVLIWQRDGIGGDVTGAAFDDWNETLSYRIGDLVTGSDSERYQSLTNNNLNNDPANEANPVSWERKILIGIYNANITYSAKDTVRASDGNLYRSITSSNIGNDPVSSSADWAPAAKTIVYDDFSFWMGL